MLYLYFLSTFKYEIITIYVIDTTKIKHTRQIQKMVKKTTTKKYVPNSKEKYMCAKHKKFFTESY